MLKLWTRAVEGPLHTLCVRWVELDEPFVVDGLFESHGSWESRFPGGWSLLRVLERSTASWRTMVGFWLTVLAIAYAVVMVVGILFESPEGYATLSYAAAAATIGPLRCRAKKSPRCYHGKPAVQASLVMGGEPDPHDEHFEPWSSDGTYLASDHSIVCDPCYIRMGQPLNPVLNGNTAGAMDAENTRYIRERFEAIGLDDADMHPQLRQAIADAAHTGPGSVPDVSPPVEPEFAAPAGTPLGELQRKLHAEVMKDEEASQ